VEQTLVDAGSEGFVLAGGSPMRISWMVSSMDNNLSPEPWRPAELKLRRKNASYIGYKPRVISGTLGAWRPFMTPKVRSCRGFNLLLI
jgi:hypothetical protein